MLQFQTRRINPKSCGSGATGSLKGMLPTCSPTKMANLEKIQTLDCVGSISCFDRLLIVFRSTIVNLNLITDFEFDCESEFEKSLSTILIPCACRTRLAIAWQRLACWFLGLLDVVFWGGGHLTPPSPPAPHHLYYSIKTSIVQKTKDSLIDI